MKTVLITGGNGRMGRCIAKGLRAAGFQVVSASRTPNEELGVVSLDVRDSEACIAIMKGVDVVIHMAYYLKCDKFREEQVPTNIIGTWNIYEAAAKNGVKRMIFGSSNHAVGYYQRTDELRDDSMHRPDSSYGLSKCFSELCGRYFSDRYGISVINVRIGSFSHDNLPYSYRRCKTWLSYDDTQQLFQKCVEADESIRFLTIYGTSNNSENYFDISGLKDLIGYEPKDNGMDHLEEAVKTDYFKGLDDYEFLGGEGFLRDPFTGEIVAEDLDTIRKRLVKDYKKQQGSRAAE
ncbi:MAG: NAD(P)-dependent oxidoreductase [Treponema sp.]|jgi:uronate dehydrogenase|nr:NAD(P)-dependent oxidoreductase [Treponema sp.]